LLLVDLGGLESPRYKVDKCGEERTASILLKVWSNYRAKTTYSHYRT